MPITIPMPTKSAKITKYNGLMTEGTSGYGRSAHFGNNKTRTAQGYCGCVSRYFGVFYWGQAD